MLKIDSILYIVGVVLMNFKRESEKVKKEFSEEFNKTCEYIAEKYPRFENSNKVDQEKSLAYAGLCVGTCLINLLLKIQVDSNTMTVLDFYSKYGNALPLLEFRDFTNTQIKELINESPLSARDKSIAYKMYVEQKTYDEIVDEVNNIADSRTIGNNKQRISDILKHTATLIYNNKKPL